MANHFLILAQAAGQSAPQSQPQGPNPLGMIGTLVFFGLAMYLLLIRPQQKQRKEQQKMLSEVKSGDKVVTSGGIHGTIANVKDKTFVVRIADGVKVEVDKASVSRVLEKSSGGGSGEPQTK